jgi:hypothetical protein
MCHEVAKFVARRRSARAQSFLSALRTTTGLSWNGRENASTSAVSSGRRITKRAWSSTVWTTLRNGARAAAEPGRRGGGRQGWWRPDRAGRAMARATTRLRTFGAFWYDFVIGDGTSGLSELAWLDGRCFHSCWSCSCLLARRARSAAPCYGGADDTLSIGHSVVSKLLLPMVSCAADPKRAFPIGARILGPERLTYPVQRPDSQSHPRPPRGCRDQRRPEVSCIYLADCRRSRWGFPSRRFSRCA